MSERSIIEIQMFLCTAWSMIVFSEIPDTRKKIFRYCSLSIMGRVSKLVQITILIQAKNHRKNTIFFSDLFCIYWMRAQYNFMHCTLNVRYSCDYYEGHAWREKPDHQGSDLNCSNIWCEVGNNAVGLPAKIHQW